MSTYLYNIEAEQRVLDSILVYGKEAINEIHSTLIPKHFYDEKHSIIYNEALRLYNNGIDIDYVTLCDSLRKNNLIDKVGGEYYIAQLTNRVTPPNMAQYYALIIFQKYVHRELINSISKILTENENNVDELIDNIETKILPIISEIKLGGYDIKDSVAAIKQLLHNIEQSDIDRNIRSYFSELDELIIRFRPANFIIIAARPSVGKTAFALSIALNILNNTNEKKIVFFSFEMSSNEIIARIISMITGIPIFDILDNRLNEEQWVLINKAIAFIEKMNLYIIDEPSLTANDITAIISKLNKKNDVGLVLIDYIQLITHKELKKQREERVSEISRTIQKIAKKENIPIIALAQLNREIEKRSMKKPMLSDLRESGSLEQDADIVMFLHRPEMYEELSNIDEYIDGLTEIIVAKNRNGSVGTAKVIFDKDRVRFKDIDKLNF